MNQTVSFSCGGDFFNGVDGVGMLFALNEANHFVQSFFINMHKTDCLKVNFLKYYTRKAISICISRLLPSKFPQRVSRDVTDPRFSRTSKT